VCPGPAQIGRTRKSPHFGRPVYSRRRWSSGHIRNIETVEINDWFLTHRDWGVTCPGPESGFFCNPVAMVAWMDPVTLWLLSEVVAPDAYASIRQQIFQRSSNDRLQIAVREATGMRLGRPYKRWLREESTWADLVARSDGSI